MKPQRLSLCHKLVFIVFAFFFLGMSPRPPSVKLNTEDIVKNFLSSIESSYASENIDLFMSFLDKKFEDIGDFKGSLQKEFLNKKDLGLKFIVDSILEEKDKILVKLHWFKKYSDLSGNLTKQEGESQFLFHKIPAGLKLLCIREDNPFFN